MKKSIIGVLVLAVVAGGAYLLLSGGLSQPSAPEAMPEPTNTKPALPTATPELEAAAPTDTPEPPPPTPEPAATDTPEPAPTDTPESAPTDTPESAATDTPESAPTDTPESAPTDSPAAAPKPQPAALQNRIYFPVFDEEAKTYNIYSAKPDGSDRKLVLEEASQPTINSDGQRIAFRSWKADNRGLIEQGVEGGDIWPFNTFFEAARPSFSPDDQSILFQSREGGEKWAIYRTMAEEYRVLRREAFPVEGEAPAWTPDGQSVVYKGCLGDHCGMLKINIDGSSPQKLTDDLSDTNPAVSPDGKTIAFMSQASGNWDIDTVNIDGSNRKQLTSDSAADGLPTWSPDGNTIAFVSERGGEWGIWAMNPDGSNQHLLFKLDGSIDGQVQVDLQNSNGWLEETIDWTP